MAATSQTVEHLQESLLHYGTGEPPFVGKGRPSGRKSVNVRLIHTDELKRIEFLEYACTAGKRCFATIQLHEQTYITKPLPKDWKRGQKTRRPGGCRYWYVWQGLDEEFVGGEFPGPVAISTPRTTSACTAISTSRATSTSTAPLSPSLDDTSSSPSSDDSPRATSTPRAPSSPSSDDTPSSPSGGQITDLKKKTAGADSQAILGGPVRLASFDPNASDPEDDTFSSDTFFSRPSRGEIADSIKYPIIIRTRRERQIKHRNQGRPLQPQPGLAAPSSPTLEPAESEYSPTTFSPDPVRSPSEGPTMDLDAVKNEDLSMPLSRWVKLKYERVPAHVPNNSLRHSQSTGIERLTREEEHAIVLRIRLDVDAERFTAVDFKDARPTDDSSDCVTLETLFDLVDSVLRPSTGLIQHLEATFWERHHRDLTRYVSGGDEDMQPLILTRCSSRSWEVFMFHLRDYVDEHKDVAWHIAISTICV